MANVNLGRLKQEILDDMVATTWYTIADIYTTLGNERASLVKMRHMLNRGLVNERKNPAIGGNPIENWRNDVQWQKP